MKHLLTQAQAELVRAGKPVEGSVWNYGEPKRLEATGKSKCRCCGYQIVKGVEVIQFVHDFVGGGSYTAATGYLHADPCSALSEK